MFLVRSRHIGEDTGGIVEVEFPKVIVVPGVFFFGDDALAFQDGLDAIEELFRIEGFGDVVVGSEFESLEDVFLHGFGREEDDGDVLVNFAYFAGQFEAVFFGHHDVADAEVVAIFIFYEFPQAFFPIGSEINFIVVDF